MSLAWFNGRRKRPFAGIIRRKSYQNKINLYNKLILENEKKEAPFRYDYKYVREGIVQLNLPNTITTISDEAFNGMRRLKNLTLPSSIQYFVTERGYETLLHNMTRLEKLVVLGAPVLYEVREETVEIPVGNGYKRERQTIIDTVNIFSKNEKGEYIYKVKLGLRLGIDH